MSSFQTDCIIWVTDIHLCRGDEPLDLCFAENLRHFADSGLPIVITGDVGVQGAGSRPFETLEKILSGLNSPVACVRGNHDKGAADVALSENYINRSHRFNDIHGGSPIPLSNRTCLIGEDGLPDFRAGEPNCFNAKLTSFPELSIEFSETYDPGTNETALHDLIARRMRILADLSTDRLLGKVSEALRQYDSIFIATHYPPSVQAAYHHGKLGRPSECGGLVNQRLGEELVKMFSYQEHENQSVTVLCGHTHEAAQVQLSHNVQVLVGEHKVPKIVRIK